MLSRDEFQLIYEQGADSVFALVTALHSQVEALTVRLKELEERLGKDSHNSSKPPSSDDYKKKLGSLREPTEQFTLYDWHPKLGLARVRLRLRSHIEPIG